MNSVRDRMTEWLIRDVVARYVYILHMPTAAYFRLKFRRGFVALIGSYIEIIDTKDTQRSTFELIQWHFEFNRRTRRNRIRLGSVRTFLAVWSCSESFACGTVANSYYFLIAYPFEYVSFIYSSSDYPSFFVSFSSFSASISAVLMSASVSVVYLKCTCFSRPIIFVSDRLTFTLITTVLFLFSDWMSPFDRVVCGEYHIIVTLA